MENYYLSDQSELRQIVKDMDRDVLEQLFLKGKSPENTTCAELTELVKTETFLSCAESFHNVCKEYNNKPEGDYFDSLKITWDLLHKTAEVLYILR